MDKEHAYDATLSTNSSLGAETKSEDPMHDVPIVNGQLRLDMRPTLEEHGPGIDHRIPQADAKPSHPELWWPKARAFLQEPFSEFWGTFIIIMFGDGVVAQVTLSRGEKGNYQSISWGWG